MRIYRLERALPDGTCNAGKVFYSCQVNSFRGCCSVDPCALPACPDTDSSSSTAPVSKSTSQSSRQTLASIPIPVSSSPAGTATLQPTSIIVNIAIASSTPTQTQTPAQVQSPSATSSPASAPGVSNAPIIAGTVSGVVALSILSILLWFCLRRRKQKREVRNSIAEYGVPNKKYVLDRPTPSASTKDGSDVFIPFGGRYDQPRLTSATPLPSQSTPKDAPTVSQEIQPAPAAVVRTGHTDSDPTTPLIDKPLPDPEKSTITRPPVHEHPFFHPLPGQSPEVPTYHPGVRVNAALTPVLPQKSTLRTHPTYHISQFPNHPAFRAPKSNSPPREHGFPQRTPEVRKYRSMSPVQSASRSHDNDQPQQQAWRHSELSTTTTKAPTSQIPGRSELEAEVPTTYLSPLSISTSGNHNASSSEFDYTNKYTNRRSQWTPISRGNTDSSKYSIPIGLGLDHNAASTSANNSGVKHELESPNPAVPLPLSLTIPTSISKSKSAQMLGPVGPNLTSPRDGGHIMSWATTSNAYHHHSQQAKNAARSRDAPSDEKEVVSPMSPERWSGATAVQMASPVNAGTTSGSGEAGRSHGGASAVDTPLSAQIASACESACSGYSLSPEAGTGTWGSWSGR
ncbi:hypothetical protein VTL71DRAFT_14006 [Oculimacula yallundae]|uniref:Epidermal growth factor receptor-like transmembrane-juxtamembrane segment domain-containing protein n=1 Tax=Oculimacula yallundae TaxID=86028 RepID=A0ABR4CM09_9HELO